MLRGATRRIYIRHFSVSLSGGPFCGHTILLSDGGNTLTFSVNGQKGCYRGGRWVPV
jgi:hypothetical protein